MINYFSPINYYTGVNPIIYAYNTNAAFGFRPGSLFGLGYGFQPFGMGNIGISGGLYSFGQSTTQNPFQTLLNATNHCGYNPSFGPVYNFGTITAQKKQTPLQTLPTQTVTPTPRQTLPTQAITSNAQTQTKPITQSSTSYFKPKQFNTAALANNAQKYLGTSEANNGHMKFVINPECRAMDPHSEEWCTDFVTYVTKETYRKQGLNAPSWFGSHDVATLKRQAIFNNKFIDTTKQADKGNFISQNIKSGDIVILNQFGASHTGFVTKVNSDGSFETIEGNVGDPGGRGTGMVVQNRYLAGEKDLSGFIRLT